jgi:hypothetical protein
MSKQINFTIVPEDPKDGDRARREYANFCAVAHTPFDMTLTFCDVRPLSEQDVQQAEQSQTVRAPVVARIALPFGVVPGDRRPAEQLRTLRRRNGKHGAGWPKGQLRGLFHAVGAASHGSRPRRGSDFDRLDTRIERDD